MKYKELLTEGYYNNEDDHYLYKKFNDTRRPRLTLRHLNKLKKTKDIRLKEVNARRKFLPVMYKIG